MAVQQVIDNVGQQVTDKVTEVGSSFLSDLLSSPWQTIKTAFSSLVTGGLLTAVITAIRFFAPELWGAGAELLGDKQGRAKAVALAEKGPGAVIADSAKWGFGVAAGGAVASDAFGKVTGGNIGGGLGTLAFAGAVVVGIGALMKNGLPVADADSSAKTAAATPGAGGTPKAKS